MKWCLKWTSQSKWTKSSRKRSRHKSRELAIPTTLCTRHTGRARQMENHKHCLPWPSTLTLASHLSVALTVCRDGARDEGVAGASRQLLVGPHWPAARSASESWVQRPELWALPRRVPRKNKARHRLISKHGKVSVQCLPDTHPGDKFRAALSSQVSVTWEHVER